MLNATSTPDASCAVCTLKQTSYEHTYDVQLFFRHIHVCCQRIHFFKKIVTLTICYRIFLAKRKKVLHMMYAMEGMLFFASTRSCSCGWYHKGENEMKWYCKKRISSFLKRKKAHPKACSNAVDNCASYHRNRSLNLLSTLPIKNNKNEVRNRQELL